MTGYKVQVRWPDGYTDDTEFAVGANLAGETFATEAEAEEAMERDDTQGELDFLAHDDVRFRGAKAEVVEVTG